MSNLPVRAVGWRILIEPVEVKRQTEGGIMLAEESIKAQEYLRYVGKVIDIGPLAYMKDDFKPHPNAESIPFCKRGQWVAYGKHAGQEIVVNIDGEQKRYRVLNDDEVLVVLDNPESVVTPI